jgi:uncharacterized protein YutE (UPF0331/DUF86 family)
VVFRLDAIRARLQRLEQVIAHLQELAQLDRPALRVSWRDLSAAERQLQLGAEVLFDIGTHILVAQYGVSPQGHEDVLEQLAQQGILDDDLRVRLKGLGGFRNLLVHDYLRIDPEKVADAVSRAPRDFDDFGQAIQRWLGDRGRGT